jgi:hypothetical protein
VPLEAVAPVEAAPPEVVPAAVPANSQRPSTHACSAGHASHAAPRAPQVCVEAGWQAPLASQQPTQLLGPHFALHAASGTIPSTRSRTSGRRIALPYQTSPKVRDHAPMRRAVVLLTLDANQGVTQPPSAQLWPDGQWWSHWPQFQESLARSAQKTESQQVLPSWQL